MLDLALCTVFLKTCNYENISRSNGGDAHRAGGIPYRWICPEPPYNNVFIDKTVLVRKADVFINKTVFFISKTVLIRETLFVFCKTVFILGKT